MKIRWFRRPSLALIVLCTVWSNLVVAVVPTQAAGRDRSTTSPPKLVRLETVQSGRPPVSENTPASQPRGARLVASPPPTRPDVSLADAVRQYNAHLDQTVELLDLWKGGMARAREEAVGLVTGKQYELRAARDLLEEKFERIRSALASLKEPERLRQFDDFLAGFRGKHRGVAEDLQIVAEPATSRNRIEAATRLLSRLRGRKKDTRVRTTGPRSRPQPSPKSKGPQSGADSRPERSPRLPNETIQFDLKPPAKESSVTPAYRGGEDAIIAGDLDPTPDVEITPEIIAKANELGNSPTRIYEFVRNHTTFEPYFGSLKGSQATLETMAGNDYDLASLLIALLRASGIPSRYVRGTVKIPTDRIQDWLGVRHPDAVNFLLNTAGISAVPVDFGANGTIDWFEVDRVWVEARVPHANYRGVDGSSGSEVWVPLDPAFKLLRCQPGIAGIPDQVPFDETGYLLQRTGLLAYEWFQNQVRDWLAMNMPGASLADVPYRGAIEPESLGLLPASLPHEAIAFVGEWTELPENLRHRYEVKLLNQFGGTVLQRTGLRTVETSLSRITISYEAAGASAALAKALGVKDEVPAFLVTLTPQLKIDGVADTLGSTVNLGDSIDVQVRYLFPNDSPIEIMTHEDRRAGDYHSLILDLHQASEALMAQKSQILIDANADVGTPSEDPDALTGELLSLVGMRYWQRVQQGADAIGDIYQYKTVKQLFEVLASSNTNLEFLYDRPFAVTPGNLRVDSKRQNKGHVGIDQDQGKTSEVSRLEGHNGSAQEHATWEEVVHVDSVSAIKALQFANETDINGDLIPGNGDVLELTTCGETSLLCPSFPSGAVSTIADALCLNGRVVTVPYCDFVMNQWHGVGWIEENPATGAGAYIISGFLAGGETTLPPFTADGVLQARAISTRLGHQLLTCGERKGVAVVEVRLGADAPAGMSPAVLAHVRSELSEGDVATVSAGVVDCLGRRGLVYSIRDPKTGEVRFFLVPSHGGSGTENPPQDVEEHDDEGEEEDPCKKSGQPVNLANGNMFHEFQDFLINPGPGLPVEFLRTYNSQSTYNGPLGHGWSHSYDIFLVEDPGVSVTIQFGDGGKTDYLDLGGGAYSSPPGQTLTGHGGGWTMRSRNGTEHEFDLTGQLTAITDRNGNQQTLSYSGGNLTTVTFGSGRTLTLGYDGSNRVTSVGDFTGRTWSFTYDGSGNLASSTTPSGPLTPAYTTDYTYYSEPYIDHNLRQIIDPRGEIIEFQYYANDRLFRTIEPEGKEVVYVYEPLVRQTREIDERGFETVVRFDDQFRLIEQIDHDGNRFAQSFDVDGNVSQTVDEAGNVTSLQSDGLGNTTRIDYADATFETWTYESTFSQVTSHRDRAGHITAFTIDPANGNALEELDPEGNLTTFTYFPNGNIHTVSDDLLRTQTFGYDANGYQTSFTDDLGHTRSQIYDSLGRRTTVRDHLGQENTYTYDVLSRVSEVNDPQANSILLQWDSVGNIISKTDGDGNSRTFTYDGLSNMTSITDDEGGTTQFQYGSSGCGCSSAIRITGIVDPTGRQWEFAYDHRGKLTSTREPGGGEYRYDYDARGLVAASTDPNGSRIEYEYNEDQRLTQKTFPDLSTVVFTYDGNGNTLTAINSATSLTFTYDGVGRLATATDDRLGGKTVTYMYDEVGRREQIVDPATGVTTYSYDDGDRLTQIVNFAGEVTTLSWDDADRPTAVTFDNGSRMDVQLDNVGQVHTVDNETSTLAAIASFQYGWSPGGNLLSLTDAEGTHSFSYDRVNRLLGALHPAQPDEHYTWDGASRRLKAKSGAANLYDAAGRLIQSGAVTFIYDANGNRISRTDGSGTMTYQYDFENRLTRVETSGGSVVQYTYDALGRRITRDVDGAVTHFFYDVNDLLAEYDGAGVLQARYTQAPEVDSPISLSRGGQTYFYHRGGLGSVVALTNATEAVVATYTYDAFGNIIEQSGSVENPLTYRAREWDPVSRLMHLRNRDYDPREGQFLQQDPLPPAFARDRYGYAQGNPVRFADPFGLQSGAYEKYKKLNDAEKDVFWQHPFSAFNVRNAHDKAFEEAWKKYPHIPNHHNNEPDAFRHAIWNCLMARDIGKEKAKKWADAHEEAPGQPCGDKKMDLHNNAVGRNLGSDPKNAKKSCVGLVSDAIKQGELQLKPK
jgi:RHS repeat-associated protein